MVHSPSSAVIRTADATVRVCTRAELAQIEGWREAFSHQRKDRRYYEIVEDTIRQGFDYRYFVLHDEQGRVRAVQPFFVHDQDLLGGTPTVQRIVSPVRRVLPRFATMRTLMVGCAAGEGHLDDADGTRAAWIGRTLHAALKKYAKQVKASLVVLKEFPAVYRPALQCLSSNGYTRVPSLPSTRLHLPYSSFEEYLNKALSKATRKDLRRKFRDAEQGEPIVMQVAEDITPYVDEVYPLYLQVYERSKLHFEKLTKEYLCRLGREMPDKVRFFIWRRGGMAVAFSLCMLKEDELHDEYVGMDYSVALDLHLYFYTLRDLLEWAMANGYKWYCSTALNYDPKLRLKSELAPLDLYVSHTSPVINFFMRRALPWLEPTRGDPTLAKFPNYAELWGER